MTTATHTTELRFPTHVLTTFVPERFGFFLVEGANEKHLMSIDCTEEEALTNAKELVEFYPGGIIKVYRETIAIELPK